MFKRSLHGVFFLIMITMLTGCITIPMGDSTLEISTGGVEFVPADTEETDGEDLNSDNNESDEELAEVSATEDAAESSESTKTEKEEATDEEMAEKACDEQDYSDITDNIDITLPIPDCAILTEIINHNAYLAANLTVNSADWEEVSEEYKEFMGGNLQHERKDISGQSVILEAVLSEDTSTRIDIKQIDDNVNLRLMHNHAK